MSKLDVESRNIREILTDYSVNDKINILKEVIEITHLSDSFGNNFINNINNSIIKNNVTPIINKVSAIDKQLKGKILTQKNITELETIPSSRSPIDKIRDKLFNFVKNATTKEQQNKLNLNGLKPPNDETNNNKTRIEIIPESEINGNTI